MNGPSDSVIPFYFGGEGARLFGCYHSPQGGRHQDAGVLLCYPAGHEYVACHRAFRQLAGRLAQRGFPVLRFDYYGSGDSAGDYEEASLGRWRQDVAAAIDELRRRASCSKVRLVGLRLGASLSILASEGREDVGGLVLWDPVLDGRRYLDSIMALHEELDGASSGSSEDEVREILGYPFSRTLRLELESLDLSSPPAALAQRILVLETRGASGAESLVRTLRRSHKGAEDVQLASLEAPELRLQRVDRMSVPLNVIQSIVSWMVQ